MKKAYVIEVYGRVQGVGFRYYTEKKAKELGIHGYVKNRPDGSVKIEAEGEEHVLEAFLQWCHQGPSWAKVQEVKSTAFPPAGYPDFRIK